MNARRVASAVLTAAVIFNAVLLLGDWMSVWSLWAWAGLAAAVPLAAALLIPGEMLRDRWKNWGRGHDTLRLRTLQLGQLAMYVAGPLDVGRLHWTDTVPAPLRAATLALAACGFATVTWSMRTNRFFMPAMRIQKDRGHQLVTGGPYRFVRHPGYAGIVLIDVCSGLAVGSWLGSLVGLIPGLLFLARAADEDRFLKAQLPGYPEYAARTRYRLLPGVW